MTQPRLPDGFAVQVDRRVRMRVLGSGSALLSGSPARVLRLAPTAASMLTEGRLEVHDAVSAQLARTLLDANVAHPRPCSGPSHRDVTVVIPVRDNAPGLRRLLSALRGVRVVVVDDGSRRALQATDFTGMSCEVQVLRHPASRGAAAARNTGLTACTTDFVAFLDSDVVPRKGWLEALLGHFSDPAVALVAPRIVGLSPEANLVARYEAVRSSLDQGRREAPVVPLGTVSAVPGAAIICRCTAIRGVAGFDETLRSGEDVDLCWRLVEAGSRMRYEPIALVAHEHRTAVGAWLARKAQDGFDAAPLAERHPGKIAPLVISGPVLGAWLLLAVGSALGYFASAVVAALAARRVTTSLADVPSGPRDVATVVATSVWGGATQLAAVLCRQYWPVALVAALLSRRCRRALLLAAVIDGVVDWVGREEVSEAGDRRLGLLPYLLLKRLDDLAYGAGLWTGVLRQRSVAPLKPRLRV